MDATGLGNGKGFHVAKSQVLHRGTVSATSATAQKDRLNKNDYQVPLAGDVDSQGKYLGEVYQGP
ncbi:hypothetical protein N7453_005491 [Penicillium expansum]|nr:hypothetical protein N7453_005491 [Penicillium expansum]